MTLQSVSEVNNAPTEKKFKIIYFYEWFSIEHFNVPTIKLKPGILLIFTNTS